MEPTTDTRSDKARRAEALTEDLRKANAAVVRATEEVASAREVATNEGDDDRIRRAHAEWSGAVVKYQRVMREQKAATQAARLDAITMRELLGFAPLTADDNVTITEEEDDR